MTNHTSKHKYFIGASLFFGVINTLINYSFGLFDHIEQLPLIYRNLDSDYLINDFFVNSNSDFSPRFYYSSFVSFISNYLGVPVFFFLGTLLSNMSVSLLTYLTGRKLFDNQKSGIIAAALVMSIPIISLGSDLVLYASMFTPTTLVFPLILLSFYFFSKRKLLYAVVCSGIISIFHVLIGFEYGLLFIAVASLLAIAEKKSISIVFQKISLVLILLAFLSINLIPHFQNKTTIESDLFIEILANFRHPHHYILSHILDLNESLNLVLFIGLWILIFHSVKHRLKEKYFNKSIQLIIILIGIAIILGWFFTEVIPLKIVTTLQTLRLFNLVKWIFLLLTAQFISQIIASKKLSIRDIPIVLGIVLLILISEVSLLKTFVILGLSLTALSLLFNGRKRMVIVYFLVITSSLLISNTSYFKEINPYQRQYFASFPLADNKTSINDFILSNSSEDAVFLTPHDFGFIRTEAKRAIVVDFKAFPFPESAMKEWYNRIQDCYGLDKEKFQTKYQELNDDELLSLKSKYKFQYAILFSESDSKFPVIYSNSEYKIIDLTSYAD